MKLKITLFSFSILIVLAIFWVKQFLSLPNIEANIADSNLKSIEKTESFQIKNEAKFNDPFANKNDLPVQSNKYEFQHGQQSMKTGINKINIDPFKDILNKNSEKSNISPFGEIN